MNSAVDNFRVFVRQVYFARPHAPLEISPLEQAFTPIYRLARRTDQKKAQSVEHVGQLPHEKEPGSLILVRRLSKILLKVSLFLCTIGDDEIRHDRQIGITIVQEGSFPVDEPQALPVEKHVVRFEQVVVTRHHVGVVMRVSRGQLCVEVKDFVALAFREYVRSLKALDECVQRRPFMHEKHA